jgi:hypothetical protein
MRVDVTKQTRSRYENRGFPGAETLRVLWSAERGTRTKYLHRMLRGFAVEPALRLTDAGCFRMLNSDAALLVSS